MKTVLVMLSTYNGEKYLREQLESLLAQKNVKISILVRDDGSSDGTQQILNEYQNKGCLSWYTGDNKKPAFSFIDLIFHADNIYDYYAFCDQDDYWLPDKLEQAVFNLGSCNQNNSLLYYCNPEIVDEQRKHITVKNINNRSQYFDLMLLVYCVPGCTMVYNNVLQNFLRLHKPMYVTMHDCWVYYICVALGGTVIGDHKTYIQYRQHGNNVIGTSKISINKKVKMIVGNRTAPRNKMILEIMDTYNDYIPEGKNKDLLRVFSKYPNSINAKLKLLLIRRRGVALRSVVKAKCRILFNSL